MASPTGFFLTLFIFYFIFLQFSPTEQQELQLCVKPLQTSCFNYNLYFHIAT